MGTEACKTLLKESEEKFNAAINEFIATGEDLNFRWDRRKITILMVASELGYKTSVETLIENGASVDLGCKYGVTALMKASRAGHADIVTMLIDHGASVDVEDDMTSTALHEAAENGHDKIVEILL